MVVFSTGNVYPLVPADGPAPTEEDPPMPVGEYAQSCLGRERVVEFVSREAGLRALMFRLNYAVDLRYGTLVDIARKVFAGEPIDLTVGYFNAIWQGDANSYALRSLELCASPPQVLNVTGPERISVREAAEWFGAFFERAASVREPGRAGRAAQRLEPLPRAARRAWCSAGAPAPVGGALGGGRRRSAEQADALRGRRWPLLTRAGLDELRRALLRGLVIPAHPLALTEQRRARRTPPGRADPLLLRRGRRRHRRRRPHHAVRDPRARKSACCSRSSSWRCEPHASGVRPRRPRPLMVAGVVGRQPQAMHEAELAARLGYDAALLSLAALKDADNAALLEHCRAVAEVIPVVGFYLQPAVGGRVLDAAFWRAFLDIERVVAIKVAPFDRYRTLDVARGCRRERPRRRRALHRETTMRSWRIC